MANNTLDGPRIKSTVNTREYIHRVPLSRYGLDKVYYSPALQNYTKFVVLRNPFDRLFSAYRDKAFPNYNQKGEVFIHRLAKELLAEKFGSTTIPHNFTITFEEFVKYSLKNRNPHWRAYTRRCGLCSIEYDYILRVESMRRDSKLFLKKHYPELGRLPAYHTSKDFNEQKSLAHSKTLKHYGELKEKHIRMLMESYKYDLKIGGYTYDPKTFEATCDIKSEDGTHCC